MDSSLENDTLVAAIEKMAEAVINFSDSDLSQPYKWGAHNEGVRMGILGTLHELRTLAVQLGAERQKRGKPLLRSQHALGQYNLAFREFEAILLGIPNSLYEKQPAPGEWPVRQTVAHIIHAELIFFTLIHYGWRRWRSDEELPVKLPEDEVARVVMSDEERLTLIRHGSVSDLLAAYRAIHKRALEEFALISDEDVVAPSVWWEDEPYSLEYRLHRFDVHLRQHTVQIETTLAALDIPPTEARLLVRRLYEALAEVEALIIGVNNLGTVEKAALAEAIEQRTREMAATVDQCQQFLTGVREGNLADVRRMLEDNPSLAGCSDAQSVTALRLALYHRQNDIAAAIALAREEPDVFEAASLGEVGDLEQQVRYRGPTVLNQYSRDGFTPLMLAAFFGRSEAVVWLIAQGADVSAEARNGTGIQPLIAAAAGGHLKSVALLLDAGADPNAAQQGGYRPLHSAAQAGNTALASKLVSAGADPSLPDDSGRLPRDLLPATAEPELVALLG